MKISSLSLAAAMSLLSCAATAQVPNQAPAAPSASASVAKATNCTNEKLSTESLVSELLDNPAAKEVFAKHVPAIKESDQIDMARPMPLRALQPYDETAFSDKVLDAIDADLAKIPLCAKAAK